MENKTEMIKLLTHYTTNWQPILDITRPILEEYTDRHGYELHIKEVEPYDKYNGLGKLEMHHELDAEDVGVFLDADVILTNLLTKIESFLDADHDIYLSEGNNMGIFIIKGINGKSFVHHMCMQIESGRFHCEQDYIEQYGIHETFNPKIVPHPCFNSFLPELYGHIPNPEEITHEKGRWLPGDFVCHLPSLSMETRIEKLKELKEKIVR